MAHPALVVAAIVGIGVAAYKLFSDKKRVFVSYYYREDRRYKDLLSAWSANKQFEFEFDDVSADISTRSEDDGAIKRVLSQKIREADVLLVLVGQKSHRRRWIQWEVTKAKQLRKRIVAVKIRSEYQSPKALLASGATWARSFEFKAIKAAMES